MDIIAYADQYNKVGGLPVKCLVCPHCLSRNLKYKKELKTCLKCGWSWY